MYPFADQEIYPFNQWYIAAWSQEIGRELISKTILGTPVVMYRTVEGEPVALADRCPHRGYPLSKSTLDGNTVQCRYHGFKYNETGRCIEIPSQSDVPPSFSARAYPVREVWQWVWIWMGDPDLADFSKIPDPNVIKLDAPGWLPSVGGTVDLKCRYQILNENLLDLSHLTFLHDGTIGDSELAMTKVHMNETPERLELARYVKSIDMDSLPAGKALNLEGPVDRTVAQLFYPPSFHMTGSDFDSAAADGIEPGRHFGSVRVLHGVTPKTPTTTSYFWAFSRDFKPAPEMTKIFHGVILSALEEDIDALTAIEDLLNIEQEKIRQISATADLASFRGRLLVQRQIRAERRTPETVP